MIQLPVDVISDKHAEDYLKVLKDAGKITAFKNALEDIKIAFPAGGITQLKIPKKYQTKISDVLRNDDIHRYIDLVLQEYEDLLISHPSKLLRKVADFESIIRGNQINRKIIGVGNVVLNSLSSRIVEAMGYQTIRDEVYPKYVRKLGIKTCVYCNANYAITDKNGNGYYDLDHWKPKSLYPYLCTSFYNLQVSCPSCNRRKSDSDLCEFFQLWNDQTAHSEEVLKFGLNHGDVARYWITHQSQKDYVRFLSADSRYEKMRDDMEERLHIEDRYKEHNDVTEEIFWKAKAYNPSFLGSLHKGLNPNRFARKNVSLPICRGDIYRFILGTYEMPEQIYLRPLSKMIQDVAKELKIEI